MGRANTVQAGIPAWLNAILAIGGLGTLISGLGVWWKNHRDSDLAEKKDARDAKKDDVEEFLGWMKAAKESAEEAGVAREEARQARRDAELAHQRQEAEMESMRNDIVALLDRVEHLERVEGDLTRLAGFVVVVKAGVESGAIPPWPSEPPHVTALMSQVKREDQP